MSGEISEGEDALRTAGLETGATFFASRSGGYFAVARGLIRSSR
jgi:hypothetical protein